MRKDNISNTVILLNNTVLSCIENDRFNEGFEILQILKDYIHDEKDFYSKYKYMYLNGVLMYCSGNKQVGISLLKEAVNILKILDSKNLITLEFNYLSHFLSENDLKEIFNGYSWLHFN